MKFSMSLPLFRDFSARDPYKQTYEIAAFAEEAGFSTLTTGHHHFRLGNQSDPLTLMAAVAARTNTIRLGTGIFLLPIHHPLRVAEQIATLDQISGGRISLGVGTGWYAPEYDAYGARFNERGARMEDALKILKLAWTEENIRWEGRFHAFSGITVYPRPLQRPHPPLWVAGVVDAAVERAARLGDAWLWGPVQSLAKGKACLDVYRGACARLGKKPDFILRRFAWMKPTRREVEDEMLGRYVNGLLAHWRQSSDEEEKTELFDRLDSGEKITPQEIARDRLLWGAPDDIIEQVKRFHEETGCEHVHVAFGQGLPAESQLYDFLGTPEEHIEMVRLFGREVIPAFKKTEKSRISG